MNTYMRDTTMPDYPRSLIAFQRQTGLTADGRAGPDTRAALMPLAA